MKNFRKNVVLEMYDRSNRYYKIQNVDRKDNDLVSLISQQTLLSVPGKNNNASSLFYCPLNRTPPKTKKRL